MPLNNQASVRCAALELRVDCAIAGNWIEVCPERRNKIIWDAGVGDTQGFEVGQFIGRAKLNHAIGMYPEVRIIDAVKIEIKSNLDVVVPIVEVAVIDSTVEQVSATAGIRPGKGIGVAGAIDRNAYRIDAVLMVKRRAAGIGRVDLCHNRPATVVTRHPVAAIYAVARHVIRSDAIVQQVECEIAIIERHEDSGAGNRGTTVRQANLEKGFIAHHCGGIVVRGIDVHSRVAALRTGERFVDVQAATGYGDARHGCNRVSRIE